MNNLGTLYKYELKKLTGKKILWITLFFSLLIITFIVMMDLFGKYYVDGEVVDTHYHMFQVDQTYLKALSGRVIDQTLLEETMDAYRKLPDSEGRYTLTKEYQTYARPYSEIFNLISIWTDLDLLEDVLNWEVDEKAFYEAKQGVVEKNWQRLFLTDTEKAFWGKKEAAAPVPMTYYYHEGYSILIKALNTISILMLLFTAICLSGVFADEHTRRTDQLILSGAKGKTIVYYAKMLAGITVSFAASAFMAFVGMVLSFLLYGAEGFRMPLQVAFYPYSYPIMIGQACLILYGILLIASILVSVFVMMLSEATHNSIAALAISVAIIIVAIMFNIPPQYRIASQIWDWLPTSFLSIWYIFDVRTIPIFGHCLISWQIVPILYLFLSSFIVAGGKRIYQKYQVSGR